MLKNIQFTHFFDEAKNKVYETLRKTNTTITTVNLYYFLITQIFVFLLLITALINSRVFPAQVAIVFKALLLSNLGELLKVQPMLITLIVFLFSLAIVLLTFGHLLLQSVLQFFSKILTVLVKLYEYLIVVMVDYAFVLYLKLGQQKSSLMRGFDWLTIVMIALVLLIILVHIKFQIRLLRNKCNIWNINNDLHFYAFTFIIFKTFLVTVYGVSIWISLFSLIIWSIHRKMRKSCINSPELSIQYNTYNYIAFTDLAVLLSLLTNNNTFAFILWMIFILALILHTFLQVYLSHQQDFCLPSCQEPPEQFYNFFYKIQAKHKLDENGISEATKQQLENIYSFHRLICPQQCFFNTNSSSPSYSELERQISQLIAFKKGQNVQNSLIHELWNLQLGLKCNISHLKSKPKTAIQDFTMYCIDKLSKDSETTLKNIESSKNVYPKLFYELIFQICTSYCAFYQQISKTTPKADSIIASGISIIAQIQKLKGLYMQLLRLKVVNFKMVEIYLQFFNNFVHETVCNEENITLMANIQKAIEYEDINENYLPTLAIYPDTGALENANCEAQSFLQMTRFELKYKTLSNLFYPGIQLQELRKALSQDHQKEQLCFYSFFKKSQQNYAFGKLKMKYKYLKEKKVLIAEIEKNSYSSCQNVVYVDHHFHPQIMLHKQMTIKFHQKGLQITVRHSWKHLFEKIISQQASRINQHHITKIELPEHSLMLIVKRLNSLQSTNNILFLQVMKSDVSSKEQRESQQIYHNSFLYKQLDNHFQFHYTFAPGNEDSIKIMGFNKKQQAISKQSLTMNTIDKQLQCQLVKNLAAASSNYAKDIKTYRLYDAELYNIDLQDKEAYNQLFEQHQDSNQHSLKPDQNPLTYFIIIALILALALIAASLLYYTHLIKQQQNIETSYKRYIQFFDFQVNMNRILALLRDHQSNLTASLPNNTFNFKQEIDFSYQMISNFRQENIFSTKNYIMQADAASIQGTLYELVDVIKSHIVEVLATGDMELLREVQLIYITEINPYMEENEYILNSSINSQLENVRFINAFMLYLSITLIALLYFFMILFCFKINERAKLRLSKLLYISDAQAKFEKQNGEKMKYMVEMSRKNFDMDMSSVLSDNVSFKKRKNAKESSLSRQIVFSILFLIVVGLINHLACIFAMQSSLNQQFDNFSLVRHQSKQIMQTYIQSSFITTEIYYTKQLNIHRHHRLKHNLIQFCLKVQNLQYSPQFLETVETFLFDNSCGIMKKQVNMTSEQCANTMPGFTVSNPFQIGYFTYLFRQNYYLTLNLTENFAHTGIYSRPLAQIFHFLALQFQKEGLRIVKGSLQQTFFINLYIILIDCLYIAIFVFIYRYFSTQYQKIKKLLLFFRKEKSKQPKKQEEQTNKEEFYNKADSSHELLDSAEGKKKDGRQLMSEANQ